MSKFSPLEKNIKDILKEHQSLLQETQTTLLLRELVDNGHGGFLKHWRKAGLDLSQKRQQLQELRQCDRELKKVFTGNLKGLRAYLDMFRKLIGTVGQKKTAIPRVRFFHPPTTDFRTLFSKEKSEPNSLTKFSEFLKAEKDALSHLNKVGMVLVAGGLGERLNSKTSKVRLNIHNLQHPQFPNDSFLDFYFQTVLTLQKLYTQKTGKKTKIPFFIMCSEHNRKIVVETARSYYPLGIHNHQIMIRTQLEAPCFQNLDGDLALNGYRLIKKPLGHGFIHSLIVKDKYLNQSMMKGKEYLFFLQDTNPQSINTLLSSYGFTRRLGFNMSWVGVERYPGEQAGLIVGEESHKQGQVKRQVVNIEYNSLNTGEGIFLPHGQFFANTNNFWIRIPAYRKALAKNHGLTPFIVNPKPLPFNGNSTKTITYKPFRPENLMQDIAQDIPFGFGKKSKARVLLYPRHLAFSPVKRSLLKRVFKNLNHNDILYTSLELEINSNRTNIDKLRKRNKFLHHSISEIPKILTPIFQYPHILLDPVYKLSWQHLNSHIQNCVFHPQSLLVVRGFNVTLSKVTLEEGSALLIYLHPQKKIRLILENLVLRNQGFTYVFSAESGKMGDLVRSRGYRIVWKNPLIIRIDKPGNYRYGKKGLVQE